MEGSQVLLELIQDNAARIHWLVDTCTADCLYWTPDKEANSIAVTIWHTARTFDVFMTQHILNHPVDAEIWYSSGWAEKTGYFPIGIGSYGWGIVSGYSVDEVRRIPKMNAQILIGYFDEVISGITKYLENTPSEVLKATAPGFENKQTNYFWIRQPLFDLTRHMGEILAIQALWARKHN